NVVPYFPLSDDVVKSIIKLQVGRIGNRVRENYKAEFGYDDAVLNAIAGRCKEVESGARMVDHILTGTLLPEISRRFLSYMADGQTIQKVHIRVDEKGEFDYQIS